MASGDEGDRGWSGRRRPYVMTGGRTQPVLADLELETLVSATPAGAALPPQDRTRRELVERCAQEILSVAEISAHLSVPVGVARVLVADLAADGLLHVHTTTDSQDRMDRRPDRTLLERVLAGLRAL